MKEITIFVLKTQDQGLITFFWQDLPVLVKSYLITAGPRVCLLRQSPCIKRYKLGDFFDRAECQISLTFLLLKN